MPSRVEELLELVRAQGTFEDAVAIETARGDVTRADLPELAASYMELTWSQRRALVTLIQDLIDEATRALMVDFLLGAPDGVGWDREPVQVARAIAVCHHDRSFEHFMQYVEDRSSLERRRTELRTMYNAGPR